MKVIWAFVIDESLIFAIMFDIRDQGIRVVLMYMHRNDDFEATGSDIGG